jgi:hypothetical protein
MITASSYCDFLTVMGAERRSGLNPYRHVLLEATCVTKGRFLTWR